MSMDYRAIDFLDNFNEETRKHIIEFGKRISSQELEADVFLVMARKAICFVDFLCEVKLAYLNGIVICDRVLDMNTEWLHGKTVTVIDDALVSGTTLKKVIDKLENAGVNKVQVFVLSINKDWYNPDMLTNSNGDTYLAMPRFYNTNEKCMQMCYDIVKALSTIPRPYDIDFPLYGEYGIKQEKLNEMLNSSWKAFNVTSASHISNSYASRKTTPKSIVSEYESITFIPPDTIMNSLKVITGIDFQNSCVLKIRAYIRKRVRKTSELSVLFLPFVIFNEVSKNDIDCIIKHFFRTPKEHEIIEHDMVSYESKFRLVQYIIATYLMKIFLADMNFNQESNLNFILTDNVSFPMVKRMNYIFTPNIVNIISKLLNSNFNYFDTLSINSDFCNTPNNMCNCYSSNSLATYDILSTKFMELYENRELKARTLAKEHGKDVFKLKQYQKDMKRLEEGYTFQDLVNTLKKNLNRNFIVSLFLDLAIDTGIAVPITYIKGESIVRAYRHGEDVIFTDVEAKQITFMLNCFLEISSRTEIPALLLEKLLTTFIRFGLHDGIFEKYDYKNIHAQERDFIKIAYYIHGTMARVANNQELSISPIIISNEQAIWLKDVLVSKKLLEVKQGKTEDLSTYYIKEDVAERMAEEHRLLERGKIAKRISHVVGYLYSKKIISENDLVLLNASFGHDQIIPALLAEVSVIVENYSFFKYAILNNFNKWHAMNSIVSFRRSALFIAQNSGFMKLRSYYNQEPRTIIDSVREKNSGNFETQHFFDEFERYWDEKLSNVKEEISANIERQIDLAAIFIIQYGLLFRTIELMIFQKHIGSNKIEEYFNNLKNKVSEKKATKRDDVLSVIKEYNKQFKHSDISAYFRLCDFEINSHTIKSEERLQEIIEAIPLKQDIEKYIHELDRFSKTSNLLGLCQAIEFAHKVISDAEDVDINCIFMHLEKLNNRAEILIAEGCRYINNRGEIEEPVEYPNLIVITKNICTDKTDFQDIENLVKVRQKKINDRRNDAELIYQICGNRIIIMTRGSKTSESLINLASEIQIKLNYNNEFSIHTIVNLNNAYSPYRFLSCVASANIINFMRWYDEFQEILKLNSNFIILSEDDISINKFIEAQLEKTKINDHPHADFLRKEYNAMYLKKGDSLVTQSTKGLTIGVICAKENERSGILQSIKTNFNIELKEKLDSKENHRLIDIGHINRSGYNHEIIVTKCDQGNTSAATAYSSLVHFKPDYVIFVGIAGTCNPAEVNIGDVILPSQIFDVTLKKEKNGVFQTRGEAYRIAGHHVGLVQLFVRKINEELTEFKVLNSAIMSDNSVYATDDSKILQSVLMYNDKIDGIEMESAGIYSADYERDKTKYGVFSIRGVSDNANNVKDDKNHTLAIDNAANVFCNFIEFIFSHIDDIKKIK